MKPKKLIILLLIVANAMCLTGCFSTFHGTAQSSVVLNQKNFKIIKTVKGEASAKYFLGIGGFSVRDGLYADARAQILASNPLQEGQALANIVTDYETKNVLGLWWKTSVIMTADIVEFTK